MKITCVNLQKRVPLNPPQVLKAAKMILRHEGVDNALLAIVFVPWQKIKALNKKYLHRDYATDVLAFDLSDATLSGKKCYPKAMSVSGDVVISADAALKNSKTYGTPLSRELTLYVVHGILHLLGYNDCSARDLKRMRKKEQDLLTHLGKASMAVVRHRP